MSKALWFAKQPSLNRYLLRKNEAAKMVGRQTGVKNLPQGDICREKSQQ
jgi:hypothetical protein